MHFIEVLERRWQLRQYGPCILQVHSVDVVPFERIDETLGHAIALRTAYRRVDWLEPQLSGDASGFSGDVGSAVVREELKLVACWYGFDRAR